MEREDSPPWKPIHEGITPRLRAALIYDRLVAWIHRHHRLARVAFGVRDALMRVQAWFLRGDGRECPCCGGRFRHMTRGRLIGWRRICPRCHSFSRQRAMALMLQNMDLRGRRILHFAPERALDRIFEQMPEARRVTADLYGPADLRLDITDIDLPDDAFDLVICSHVLEHIEDDRAAMGELARVVAPGGMALIMVPIRPAAPTTFEDPSITTPRDRMLTFGQPDHLRIYGSDLRDRLGRAGFDVEDLTLEQLFDAETVARCELRPTEHLFRCRVRE